MTAHLAVIIPAIKKNVAFPDDLVKKLAGRTLVGRAIEKARTLVGREAVFLITDSEEIRLIGERAGVSVYWNKSLSWENTALPPSLLRFMRRHPGSFEYCLLLSPYAPLLDIDVLRDAYKALVSSGKSVLIPVRDERRVILQQCSQPLLGHLLGLRPEVHKVQFRGFCLFAGRLVGELFALVRMDAELFPVSREQIEIDSYQSWWICEKLLQRKRIVFLVIGNEQVGMGHIYRALSLAHEISDHEIMFVCDDDSALAAHRLAGYDYWLASYPREMIIEEIIDLKPDLLINDVLNTDAEDIICLQRHGIRVVNFEDMGSGAVQADLTINELYDEPQFSGENLLWGHDFFFVRDEFNDARPHRFKSRVEHLLLVFGGTDQLNLSQSIYRAIRDYCCRHKITIHIVTGPGYASYDRLAREVADIPSVTLTRATGVISELMERCQIAITSNGRTVYELAHMNIPSIVIAQHERENTHAFACMDNGFLPLGVYEKGRTETEVVDALSRLVEDIAFRRQLFDKTTRFRFNHNKEKVIKRILSLIGS